jgi:hypothetical protein
MKKSAFVFSKVIIGLFMSALIYGGVAHSATNVCRDCNPQCVKYAEKQAGINCSGNAGSMSCTNAKKVTGKDEYPRIGDVIETSIHAMYVENAEKGKCKDKKCHLKISDTNWQNGCHGAICNERKSQHAYYDKGYIEVDGGPSKIKVKAIWRKN